MLFPLPLPLFRRSPPPSLCSRGMHQALRLLLKAETLYLRTKASADEDASALEGAYTMTCFLFLWYLK